MVMLIVALVAIVLMVLVMDIVAVMVDIVVMEEFAHGVLDTKDVTTAK